MISRDRAIELLAGDERRIGTGLARFGDEARAEGIAALVAP